MLRIIIVRPGSTEFEEQGRITGRLNIPLSAQGEAEVNRTADELHEVEIQTVYSSPCESAQQTARLLSRQTGAKLKTLDGLLNLDLGLWNGKLVDELKKTQPKLYRQWQEHPETVCPPDGETLEDAQRRVDKAIQKIIRKHREGTVAIIVPEPLTTILISRLRDSDLGDLWKAEGICGRWESLEIEPSSVPSV